jgi:large subunit ribosomal protein L18
MDKKISRLRRSQQTRIRIAQLRVNRLSVFRSNQHIYATITTADGSKVLASASSVEAEVKGLLAGKSGKGGNVNAAQVVGQVIARRAQTNNIQTLAFDRSGFKYHGRIKALADAAREGGLKF